MTNFLFKFNWTDGAKSVNDYIIKWLKENKIKFYYNGFSVLMADVYGINLYLAFDYKKINSNTYGVFIKK